MQPEKDRINEQLQPDGCQINDNTNERKYNQPDSNSLAKIEKQHEGHFIEEGDAARFK